MRRGRGRPCRVAGGSLRSTASVRTRRGGRHRAGRCRAAGPARRARRPRGPARRRGPDALGGPAPLLGGKFCCAPCLVAAAYLGLGGRESSVVVPVAAATRRRTSRCSRTTTCSTTTTTAAAAGLNAGGSASAKCPCRRAARHAADERALTAGPRGDLALTTAFRLLAPRARRPREHLADLLADGIETAVAGETCSTSSPSRSLRDVDALLVAALKTAEYTCRSPLASGAAPSAGARPGRGGSTTSASPSASRSSSPTTTSAFGDPAATGKSTLSDLRRGKRGPGLLRLAYAGADRAGRAVPSTGGRAAPTSTSATPTASAASWSTPALGAMRLLVERTRRHRPRPRRAPAAPARRLPRRCGGRPGRTGTLMTVTSPASAAHRMRDPSASTTRPPAAPARSSCPRGLDVVGMGDGRRQARAPRHRGGLRARPGSADEVVDIFQGLDRRRRADDFEAAQTVRACTGCSTNLVVHASAWTA